MHKSTKMQQMLMQISWNYVEKHISNELECLTKNHIHAVDIGLWWVIMPPNDIQGVWRP